MKPIREIASKVHAYLYSTNLELKQQTISEYYSPDATFDDPLVSVQGIQNIQAQFRFLSWFSFVHSEILSVLISTSTNENLNEMRDLVIIDATLTFGFFVIPLPIRCISRLEFRNGKIVKHEDIWSLAHLLQSIPMGGGWIYDKTRSLNGYLSSIILRKVTSAYHSLTGNEKYE
jgi:hypothetical protein